MLLPSSLLLPGHCRRHLLEGHGGKVTCRVGQHMGVAGNEAPGGMLSPAIARGLLLRLQLRLQHRAEGSEKSLNIRIICD